MAGCDSQMHAHLPVQCGRCPCDKCFVMKNVDHKGSTEAYHMWPDGAWRETWEEYWKAGCSLIIRRSRKIPLDFQQSSIWISKNVGFPTWKVLVPVPQHLCLLLSLMCLDLWIKLSIFHYEHIYFTPFKDEDISWNDLYLKVKRFSNCALSAVQWPLPSFQA